MLVYITSTGMSILFAYISEHICRSSHIKENAAMFLRKLFSFFSFLPLFLVSMIRFDVGRDFLSYRDLYIHPSVYTMYAEKGVLGEKGFVLFNNILHLISNNPQIFFVASSLVICSAYYIAIYRESLSPPYSILLFVIGKDFFISMTGIRQYMAIAIAICSIPLIKKGKKIKAFAVLALAATFHTSILAFILIYIMFYIEIPPKVGWMMTIVTTFASNTLLKIIVPILRKYNIYFTYFARGIDKYNSSRNTALEVLLISLSFYVFLCYIYPSVKKNQNLKLMYSAVLYGLLVSTMSPVLPMSSYRLTWFMNAFIVLYTPEAIKASGNRRFQQLMYFFITISYFGATIYALFISKHQGVLPYKTIWG